jgi:hypothetical protein
MLLLVGFLALAVWVVGLIAYPAAGWYVYVPLAFAVAAFAARFAGWRHRERPPRGPFRAPT